MTNPTCPGYLYFWGKDLATTIQLVAAEPIYQVARDITNTWVDVSKEFYDYHLPERRRIVYTPALDAIRQWDSLPDAKMPPAATPPRVSEQDERALFEAWLGRPMMNPEQPSHYNGRDVRTAWEAWQAGRAALTQATPVAV